MTSLASFEVDFTGHLTATEERQKTYLMATAIANHIVRRFRLSDSKADAFLNEDIVEASFNAYGDVVVKDFYPLVYNFVSLTTQNSILSCFSLQTADMTSEKRRF